jgi:hypothetical protein
LDWTIVLRAAFSLGSAIALSYAAMRIWRERDVSDPTDKSRGFRTRIGFSQLDGMASLSLLLANECESHIWAEEIEIVLNDLSAEQQAAEPSYRGVQKIRQMLGPHDSLPISLAGVIYKAAGDPQRRYSCVLSSLVRYRIGDENLERALQNYKIRMIGLTADGIARERKSLPRFQAGEKSPAVPALAARVK